MYFELFFLVITLPSIFCSGSSLLQVQEITCQDGDTVELHVKEHTWNVDGELSFTTRAYYYNDAVAIPGPTILMKAGTRCHVTVVNDLDDTSEVATCSYHDNTLHCPDTTNLHTHGLHVSPDQDLIDSHILPGTNYTYTYDIPEDHLMGTHWYHAHHHGSTTLHANGGLAGALLIEPADDYVLDEDLAALYESSDVSLMMIHHVNFGGTDTGTSEAFTLLDYQAISDAYKTDNPEGVQTIEPSPVFHSGENDIFVVNGQYQPVITAKAGEVFLLRIVYSAGYRIAELELDDCEMKLLARDGVFQYTPYQTVTAPTFVPGTRADIAVKCDSVGTVTASFNPDSSRDALGTENRATQDIVFTINVTSDASVSPITEFPDQQATLPSYLDDISGDVVLSVGSQDVTSIELTLADSVEMINNVPFPGFEADEDDRYVERICLGRTYEFTVTPPAGAPPGKKRQGAPATGVHPYHQHVNHFQVVDLNGANGVDPDIIRVGEWRDVVPAFAPSGVTFRFTPHDFTGDTVLHCHLLQHEDHGMMGLFDISDCGEITEESSEETNDSISSSETSDSISSTMEEDTEETNDSTSSTMEEDSLENISPLRYFSILFSLIYFLQ